MVWSVSFSRKGRLARAGSWDNRHSNFFLSGIRRKPLRTWRPRNDKRSAAAVARRRRLAAASMRLAVVDPPSLTRGLFPLGGLVRLAPRFIHLEDPFAGAVQVTSIR